MITVKPHSSYSVGFIVEGHANYAPHGQDILCASVSVASYMAARTVNSFEVESKEGYTRVKYKSTSFNRHVVNVFLATMRELEQQYPNYITVEDDKYDRD